MENLFSRKTDMVLNLIILQMNNSWQKMMSLIPEGIAIFDSESKQAYYANHEFNRIIFQLDLCESGIINLKDGMKNYIQNIGV